MSLRLSVVMRLNLVQSLFRINPTLLRTAFKATNKAGPTDRPKGAGAHNSRSQHTWTLVLRRCVFWIPELQSLMSFLRARQSQTLGRRGYITLGMEATRYRPTQSYLMYGTLKKSLFRKWLAIGSWLSASMVSPKLDAAVHKLSGMGTSISGSTPAVSTKPALPSYQKQ